MTEQRPYQARFIPKGEGYSSLKQPFKGTYPISLSDGSCLELPLQPFPDGQMAIALLMSNQTDFEIEQGLTPLLTELAHSFAAEAIVGIPTLGLDYARQVAQSLGFPNYTALGNSRKFWYNDELAIPVESITSSGVQKRLYIDPNLINRVAGKRIVIVDDVINTGGTAAASIQLLEQVSAEVVGLVVVLTEGQGWKQRLQSIGFDWHNKLRGVGHIPMFHSVEGGWLPITDSASQQ